MRRFPPRLYLGAESSADRLTEIARQPKFKTVYSCLEWAQNYARANGVPVVCKQGVVRVFRVSKTGFVRFERTEDPPKVRRKPDVVETKLPPGRPGLVRATPAETTCPNCGERVSCVPGESLDETG